MKAIRAWYRLIGFALLTVYHAGMLIVTSLLLGMTPKRGMGIRMKWAKRSINFLGIQVEWQNEPPAGGHLFLSNHRSYMEAAVLPSRFMSSIIIKKEVRDWPVLGFGAKASFSVFVDRNDKDSRRHTREQIAELMRQGFSVLIFPEGTTFEGPGVKQLKPGPFQIAQDGNFTVVPVALEYKDLDDAWVGDDTFQRHFLVCFRKPHVRMKIKFGEPRQITNWETDMAEVQSWLDAETRRMREEFDLE